MVRILWGSGVAITAIGAFVIFSPFGSDRLETAVDVVALASVPVFLGVGFPAYSISRVARGEYKPRRSDAVVMALLILYFVVVLLPYIRRDWQAELLRAEFDGTVVRKYNSDNHQAESMEVRSEDGSLVVMEGIEHSTWLTLAPDDRLTKSSWSPYARLNGERVRLVPHCLLDSIRRLE